MSEARAERGAVAIIGGGWAGLSCALHLAELGRPVSLFEAAPQWGGRARTARLLLAGTEVDVDNGQHLLLGAYRETLDLIGRLHAAAVPVCRRRLDLRGPEGFRLRRWPLLPGRLGIALGLLCARGLSGADKLVAIRLMRGLQQAGWRPPAGRDTVAGLLDHYRQTGRMTRMLWEPLCLGALNIEPAFACARSFAAVLRDSLGGGPADSDLVLPAGTLGELLPDPAVRWLRAAGAALVGAFPVGTIDRDAGGWRVTRRGASDTHPERFEHLVVATDAHAAAGLVAPISPETGSRLLALGQASIATVYLGWRRPVSLPGIVMLDAADPLRQPGQWLFDRGRHGELRVAAVVVSARDRISGLDGRALASAVAAQLSSQFGLPAPDDARTISERRATWRCTAARPRLHAESAAEGIGEAGRGLWLAGDYLDPDYPATLESATRSGKSVAGKIGRA